MATISPAAHQRMPPPTRLDGLPMPTSQAKRKAECSLATSEADSPRDSLSPLDEIHECDFIARARDGMANADSRDEAQTTQEPHIAFSPIQGQHEAATTAASTTACVPRFLLRRDNRPRPFKLTKSNGLTTLPPDDLKHSIRHACDTAACATKSKVVQRKPERLPKSSVVMGNQQSTVEGGADDSASLRSVIRSPKAKALRLPRKSSMNVFKRGDLRSPLPADLTATVIEIPRASTAPNLDGAADDEESPVDPFMAKRYSAPSPNAHHIHTASTATVTEANASQPLSASNTITDFQSTNRKDSHLERDDRSRSSASSEAPPVPAHRNSALSPTIPAPSPLPEDSPHKYGLRDRMDTPDMLEPDINVAKARRRSSGLEVFNEAKSLQSATSFLNGVSAARRRAESATGNRRNNELRASDSTDFTAYSTTTNQTFTSAYRSKSAGASQSQLLPPDVQPDAAERLRGHDKKFSGYLYSRPLSLTQLKCYRSHARLLMNRNKHAPVECAVCHIDDAREHFTCSWCALRMCRFCRKDFHERGLAGLKEKIRGAELGDGGSRSSSAEEVGVERGRKAFA